MQNHVSIERGRISVIMIVFGDHDFLLRSSNFGNLAAFRAIFSHIFTAHAREFPVKILTQAFDSLYPVAYIERYFGDLRTLSIDFCT